MTELDKREAFYFLLLSFFSFGEVICWVDFIKRSYVSSTWHILYEKTVDLFLVVEVAVRRQHIDLKTQVISAFYDCCPM
jgi:hypothetical protein